MLLTRKGAAPNLRGVRLECVADLGGQVRVALHEPRQMAFRQTEEVVVDEHLPVAVAAGADPDRRDLEVLRDVRRDRRRHRFQHEREGAGVLQSARVRDEPHRLGGRLALGPEAAERRRRLRRQADVADHRDPGLDDRTHP